MKSSELSNGENRIALRQLLQNRKLCHLWHHNLGSRWKLQKKMARENFSIGAFYNISKNQDNAIKTVGQDSFWAPKPLKTCIFSGFGAQKTISSYSFDRIVLIFGCIVQRTNTKFSRAIFCNFHLEPTLWRHKWHNFRFCKSCRGAMQIASPAVNHVA